MSIKTINKQYRYKVAGVQVGNREAARVLQRSMRRAGEAVEDTKIVQQVLMERIVR